MLQKFKTTSRHAKHRVFETVLEGMAVKDKEGNHVFSLQIEGATNNLNALKDEIARTIEDKHLIDRLKGQEHEDTGLKVISHIQHEGYDWIEHPNFVYWQYIGTVEGGEIKDYYTTADGRKVKLGKNIRIQTKGDKSVLLERRALYAPAKIAKRLNKILGVSKLKGIPIIDTLTKYNAIFKSTILMTSFFHHMAFARSYWFGTRRKTFEEWNLNKARKEGLKAIQDLKPELIRLVRNGLTLGRTQDWEESILTQEDTMFGRAIDKAGPMPKAIKNKIKELRERQARFLFQNFGAGLKATAGLIEYRNALKDHPDMDPNDRAKMVASLINDDFGGLHLQRMERNPTLQHIFRLLALAPDWCSTGDTRAMTKTGWKYQHELKINDEIMAFDSKTKTLKWSKLKDKYVNAQYSGKMVQIKSVNRSILMTPDHTCYVYSRHNKSNCKIINASQLKDMHIIPRTANFHKLPEKEIFSDFFVELVGWFRTDGCVKHTKYTKKNGDVSKYTYGVICQSRPDKVEILKKMGMKCYNDENKTSQFKVNHMRYLFKIPREEFKQMEKIGITNPKKFNWDFLSKLTEKQLGLLYHAMWMGDGSKKEEKEICGDYEQIQDVVMVNMLRGKPASFKCKKDGVWVAQLLESNGISCRTGNKSKISEIDYTGTIWCPSVDTGFWLAERKGLVFITGNTESNVRTMVKAFKAGSKEEESLYRHFWASVATKGLTATAVASLLLSLADEDDPVERFKKAWDAGHFRWLSVDVTPIYQTLYKMMGKKPTEARKYISLIGHFKDPVKFIFHPFRSAHHKGSVLYGMLYEAMAGTDWKGAKFTTMSELLGIDDKGYYLTNTKAHKRGEEKGGQLQWQAVSYRASKQGTISVPQIPSYLLSQMKGVTPIQVQQFVGWLQGEIEGFDAVTRSLGMAGGSTYPSLKKAKKRFIRNYIKVKEGRYRREKLKKELDAYNKRQKDRGEETYSWGKMVKAARRQLRSERIYKAQQKRERLKQ